LAGHSLSSKKKKSVRMSLPGEEYDHQEGDNQELDEQMDEIQKS
jgi:hypothetical protein